MRSWECKGLFAESKLRDKWFKQNVKFSEVNFLKR